MSGLVCILANDPQVRGRGPAALALLEHLPTYERRTVEIGDAWFGVCGRGRERAPSGAGEGAGGAAGAGGEGAGGDSRCAVAFAGEILNAAALQRELGLAAEADTIAIASAAAGRWGGGLFAHLEGIYTLIIRDAATGLTLAGTDPYGVAYLQLTKLGGDLLIASEAKAFLADPRFAVALNNETLACVVALGHDFGRGLFAGVLSLRQGFHFEITGREARTVRHWDAREAVGALGASAYVDRLADTIEELSGEIYAGGEPLIPLTGGLDSRLLAAVKPASLGGRAFTYGDARHPDCVRAAQIAAAAGMAHEWIPFQPDFIARHAAATIWLTDGRLTPAENTTGFQMEAFDGRPYFVSGVCCGLGRRFSKAKTLLPDWSLTDPDNLRFEPWAMMRFSRSGMTLEEVALAFGARGDAVRAPGIEILADFIGESRGFTGVDRLDLYFTGGRARGWRCSGLDLAGTWLAPRAPFLARRWIEAVLAGAPDQRLDDQARLRLIRRINPAVARVPWVMTRLPLGPSELVLQVLRETACLRRLLPGMGGPPRGPAKAGDGAAPSAVATRGASRGDAPRGEAPRGDAPHGDAPHGDASREIGAGVRTYMRVVKGIAHKMYDYGDLRDEWLRGPSRAFVNDVLLSPRLGDRGVADPDGVRRLVAEHMNGHDHTLAISILLQIELWHRCFVDGERPWPEPGA